MLTDWIDLSSAQFSRGFYKPRVEEYGIALSPKSYRTGSTPVEIRWSTPPATQRAKHRADMAEWWREQSRRG